MFSGRYYEILTEQVINKDLFLDAFFVWLENDKEITAKKRFESEKKTSYQKDLGVHSDNLEVIEFESGE